MNGSIDLSIYMDGADLIRHGVNPYAFDDSLDLRTALRLDSVGFNDFTTANQARWNSYAASNPPLSLVFYRAVAAVSFRPVAYRIAFALCDSLLAAAIALFILRFWGPQWTPLRLGAALALGAFSPVLFKWGTLIPEDKGLEILLMVVAVYLSRSRSRTSSYFVSAFVLGCSIAFKILGAFLIPLCLQYAVYDRSERSGANRKVEATTYLLLVAASCLVWFIPFMPDVISAMVGRFQTTAGPGSPIHGSPWRFLIRVAPNGWEAGRLLAVSGLTLFIGIGVATKRLTTGAATTGLLVVYVCLLLTGGSMDRMNMALLPALLILGSDSPKWSVRLVAIYAVIGALAAIHYALGARIQLQHLRWWLLRDDELPDAVLTGVMVTAIFAALLAQFRSGGAGAARLRAVE